MYKCLAPGCVGINLPWEQWPRLAAAWGFDAVDVSPLDASRPASFYIDALEAGDIRPGGTPLPVEFRKDAAAFAETLATLDAKAKLAREVGCTRFYTWILPASDELPFEENHEVHARRLGECAKILGAHGCRLGLEFVGPKTSRDGRKHAFIHTAGGMLDLCGDVGPNAGLALDSWHWYTSHGRLTELTELTDDRVVYVHVNDAPEGIDVDEQVDSIRRLPGETGVEDIAGFMGALAKIGYTGPVTPEPFVQELAGMSTDDVMKRVRAAMEKIWPE